MAKAAGPFPGGFPWGWFLVAPSSELPRGTVRTVRLFGKDLVAFRGDDGVPAVFDAHCPHLGAHLGDGRVVGGTLECPFHRWRFGTSGACAAVPYATRLPRARAKSYPVREWNGLVLAFYHPAGAEPSIDMPDGQTYDSADWSPWHRTQVDVQAPIYDIAENPADAGHFLALHKYVEAPRIDYRFDGPISSFDQRQSFRFFGVPVSVHMRATSYGPGVSIIHMDQVVDMVVLLNTLPIERNLTRLYFSVKARKRWGLDRAAATFASWQLQREVLADKRIWEKKAYVTQPILCDGDGPILRFRKWYRQFYDVGDEAESAAPPP